VPSIPASSSTTIYIYYGNPSATSQSNGANTFIFFDDFTGTTIDTTKWVTSGTGSYTISNGLLSLTNPFYVSSITTYTGGYALRVRIQIGTDQTGYAFAMFQDVQGAGSGAAQRTAAWRWYGGDNYFTAISGNGASYQIFNYPLARDTNFHVAEARRTGTADYFQLDDTTELQGNYPTNAARYVVLSAQSGIPERELKAMSVLQTPRGMTLASLMYVCEPIHNGEGGIR
jgi:hypothetical protein